MTVLVMFSVALTLGATHSWEERPNKAVTNASPRNGRTTFGIQETAFTLNGKPTFLLGISYYGALGASEDYIREDLADMKRYGLNWIRVWATWAAFDEDVSAVDGEGRPRPAFLKKLRWLVAECDRKGLVVDVTLSRGNGTSGPSRLQTLAAHRRAVETLINSLKPFRNWYLDLANERNIKDQRYTPWADLKELRAAVRSLDPGRLVTASHAGDINLQELGRYLLEVRVDFLAPHRPRHRDSPQQTEQQTRAYLAALQNLGRSVPLHYQEPFRRGYGTWQPRTEDYLTDLQGAQAAGAAGWCFHNGDQKGQAESRLRRSFDLRDKRIFDQLDLEETAALRKIHSLKKAASKP